MVKRYCSQVEFSCNVFLITNDKNESILIDPGFSSKRMMEDIKNTKLIGILLTHGHFDHIASLDRIKSIYKNADVYCFEEDDFLKSPKKNCSVFTNNVISITSSFKSFDDCIKIGDFEIEVILTPGHTAGGAVYYFKNEKSIFFGDTIIESSIGRMDLYSSSPSKMKDSLEILRNKDFKDDDMCYFGHGQNMDYKTLKIINSYLR